MNKFKITYKMDLQIVESEPLCHLPQRKKRKIDPIGDTITIQGSLEDIKKSIIKNVDDITKKLEEIYYGNDGE